MIKVMSFSSGVRTRYVFGWVSIIWFTSAVSIAVSNGLELQTISQVAAQCGKNVTLTCEATSSEKLDIQLFSWLAINKTQFSRCQYQHKQHDPQVLCESMAETTHHRLTLTLLNVMPTNQGRYLCKLRTTQGVKSDKTDVTVEDCFGSSGSSINNSHAECWFKGVYPIGTVHWFQEDVDLTDSASTQEEQDQHGLYNILSTINVQEGNPSKPYNCSLWMPSATKYISTQYLEIPTFGGPGSSGSMVKLQWFCMILEIMIVKFMT